MLADLYLKLHDKQAVRDRIDFLSHYFLGKPYIANPQGEGENAPIDPAPLFRFDGFDCVTYVNNILALALSHDEKSFEKKLLQLNYYDAIPIYENRFHFMSVDWNPENQKNNIVKDVTEEIGKRIQKLQKLKEVTQLPTEVFSGIYKNMAEFAEGDIDRPNWFIKKGLNHLAQKVKREFVRLPYLPLKKLFDENKNPQKLFFDQIPDVCVIEIVRPNWNLKEKIGTNLHVSHAGFAIRKKSGELFFRHASSENKCVTEILLSDYLKNCLESPTIRGVNVQVIWTVEM